MCNKFLKSHDHTTKTVVYTVNGVWFWVPAGYENHVDCKLHAGSTPVVCPTCGGLMYFSDDTNVVKHDAWVFHGEYMGCDV